MRPCGFGSLQFPTGRPSREPRVGIRAQGRAKPVAEVRGLLKARSESPWAPKPMQREMAASARRPLALLRVDQHPPGGREGAFGWAAYSICTNAFELLEGRWFETAVFGYSTLAILAAS